MPKIASVQLIVGLEVHVELATRTKLFTRAPNPAHSAGDGAPPNTLIDPVVLALPGSLPVMNLAAVELSMMVGMALGCEIAPPGSPTRWDRKSYFYPDLPKNYQISQYLLPLCFDGAVDLPPIGADGKVDWERLAGAPDAAAGLSAIPGSRRIGIIRAHLEEDAGKLLHEWPVGLGERPHAERGGTQEDSYVDWNRAGTPLLEIVTQPDFRSSAEVVVFAQMLRNTCRFLGATEGVMQKGHMRFEPNINCLLTLADGRTVKTPIVEIKNLNSFKSVRGSIEYELREQPRRWLADGLEMGPGAKTTRGWDDERQETFIQREKEDAHDYRYFPDPDLPPVRVDEAWRERVRGRIPELPLARARRYMREYGLSPREAAAITDERDDCLFFEASVSEAVVRGVPSTRAGRAAANLLLQSGLKRANERAAGNDVLISALGLTARHVAGLVVLRESGRLSAQHADELFGLLCEPERVAVEAEAVAAERRMLIVRDDAALDRWCDEVIAREPKAVEDVRAGRMQAIGRMVGAVMKLAGGAADAKTVRERLLAKLGVKE